MLKSTAQPTSGTAFTKQPKKFDTQRFVDAHQVLAESYERFTDDQLGITTPTNILELAFPSGNMDPYKRVCMALIAENFVKKVKTELVETSRADLPNWVKNGLALIMATHAEDLLDQVISVQPLQSRSGRIHYLDIQTERSKGAINSSFRLFDALRGYSGNEDYSSEQVKNEAVGAAGSTDYAVTLEYLPVIPGSFEVTDGTQVIRDDMNGNLVGDIQAAGGGFTNTINYVTGAISFRFASASIDNVVANYTYNIEATDGLPQYGISLRSIQVEARPRAIEAAWSIQAVQDLTNDWGIDAEPTIMDAGAKIIQAERFKHVVNLFHRIATGGSLVFDNTQPVGISYREHLDAFGILLTRLQTEIWRNTQKVRPNVAVIAPDILFLFQHTVGYKGEGISQGDNLSGPKKAGRLENHGIDIIVDPTFPPGKGVLTYKGGEIISTAAVLGMYIPLYKSPIHQKGFKKDTALLSEYCIHPINTDMMGTLEAINL